MYAKIELQKPVRPERLGSGGGVGGGVRGNQVNDKETNLN